MRAERGGRASSSLLRRAERQAGGGNGTIPAAAGPLQLRALLEGSCYHLLQYQQAGSAPGAWWAANPTGSRAIRCATGPSSSTRLFTQRPTSMATAARALRLLGASLHRRPTAAAAFTSAAAASRCSGSAVLRSANCGRLAQSVQRLGALHGAAVVCSAAGADGELVCVWGGGAGSCQLLVRAVETTATMVFLPASHMQRGSGGSPVRQAHAVDALPLPAGLVEVQLKVDGMVCEGCR